MTLPSNCCNLEEESSLSQLSGRWKGEPAQTRSSAFIDPMRNLAVSPGGSALRLGSLLSAFISVSFTMSLSSSPPALHLPLPTPPLPLRCSFSPEEPQKEMSPDQIRGSAQHILSSSVCLLRRVIKHQSRKFPQV